MNKLITFENTFKMPLRALYLIGAHPDIPRKRNWTIYFCINCILTLICMILLVISILVYDIADRKYADVCKNGTMVAIGAVVTIKYIVLLVNQKQIQSIIEIINEDYETAESLPWEERKIVNDYVDKGIFVGKIWFIISIISSNMFPVIAICKMIYSYWSLNKEFVLVPMFDVHYPGRMNEIKNELPMFISMFILCLWFGIYCGSMYMGFEPLGPIFMLHFCGQFQLAKSRILKLFTDDTDVEVIRNNLKIIIKHTQRIYSCVWVNKRCFTVVYEVSMKATTIVIPITLYQILESLHEGYLSIEFICLFCGSFIHCYVPCYYSHELMDEGEALRQAIYASGWEKMMDKPIRRMLFIMLTQASRSLALKSIFTILNLDSFAQMCKQSYGLFNLMNAAFD